MRAMQGGGSFREDPRLNGVRPRRPEQSGDNLPDWELALLVSMESGLEGRNNHIAPVHKKLEQTLSQWSPA